MKTVPATMVSMAVGWAVPLLGLIAVQLISDGHTTDVAASASWTGLFAVLGWLVAVLPLSPYLKRWPALSSVAYAWLGWGGLGMAAFVILTVPWAGWIVCVIIWYPALVGALAGLTFSLINRRAARISKG